MKIAFVTELYAPSVGGMESRFKALAEELTRQGHVCEVWCIGHAPGLTELEDIGGVTVRRIVSHPQYKAGGAARRHWPTVFRFCWELWKRRDVLAGFGGIVLGKWPLLHSLLVPFPAKVPIRQDWCEQRSGNAWQAVYRLIASRQRLDHVAINGGIAQWLETNGVAPDRIATIGSAADVPEEPVRRDRADQRILFFGRLNEHKQPLLLLEAFASHRLGDQGFSLHFAGAGPQGEELAERAAGVPGIVIHGRVSDQKKFELLAEASLLALPSLREGFPVVVAEACAMGTPTLTIDAPDNGTAYILNQLACGWVVPNSAEALAQAMAECSRIEVGPWIECSTTARARADDTLSIAAQARALVAALAGREERV